MVFNDDAQVGRPGLEKISDDQSASSLKKDVFIKTLITDTCHCNNIPIGSGSQLHPNKY
jgi:hypothetical protein